MKHRRACVLATESSRAPSRASRYASQVPQKRSPTVSATAPTLGWMSRSQRFATIAGKAVGKPLGSSEVSRGRGTHLLLETAMTTRGSTASTPSSRRLASIGCTRYYAPTSKHSHETASERPVRLRTRSSCPTRATTRARISSLFSRATPTNGCSTGSAPRPTRIDSSSKEPPYSPYGPGSRTEPRGTSISLDLATRARTPCGPSSLTCCMGRAWKTA